MKMRKLKHLKPLPTRVRYPWLVDIETWGPTTGRMSSLNVGQLRKWRPPREPEPMLLQMDFAAVELRVLALGMKRASAAMKAFAHDYGVKP